MSSPPHDGARVSIEMLSTFRDARGCLFEPLDDQELARQKNVHVVLTQPGAVRGNHRHQYSTEMTTVVGPCQVRLRESGVLRDIDVPDGEVWRFTIPPGIAHAYRNSGDRVMAMVSFNTHVHDAAHGDTVREQIL
jgi:dTDP-4-dehydrorhamnose 3,5-epimerase-like enzyme